MYNHIFNSQSRSITKAAGILAVASLVSGILGLLRDRLLAGSFGAGDELDIYYAAFRIPDFISMVLVMGAISAAIIPIFSEYLVKSRKEAWRYFSNLLNLFLFFLVIISGVLIIFVPQILFLVAPGFSGEKKELTVILTRIMFLSPILLGVSNIISGILRVFRRFLVTSIAPIMYNLGIIFGILFFVPLFGLKGLAWGVVFGAFLHLLVQVPILLRVGFWPQRIFNFSHPGFWKTVKMTLPRAMGLAASQINLVVITAIGSTLAAGSIAVFNLANNLRRLPITLIGVAFSTAAFPFLASYFSKGEKEKFVKEFFSIFKKILFLMVPLSFLIFILRAQIIRVILGTGKFVWADTQLTAACIGIFSIGVLAYGLVLFLSKTFYAMHDTKTPAFISLVAVVVNIILAFLFVWLFSFENSLQRIFINFLDLQGVGGSSVIGLPLALSLAGIFQLFLLLTFFHRKLKDFKVKYILKYSLKILIAGFISALVCRYVLQLTADFVNMQSFWGIFLQAALSALVGVIVYILIVWRLGILASFRT